MHLGSCWQCEHPAVNNLFCTYCNSLQRPMTDYFSFFGLPHKLRLDEAELQQKFYQLSKLLHPDRYTRRPQRERDYSLEATAILNNGYRVLRDPVQRAEYVLREQGLDNGEPRSNQVPPELLEEVFEWNMALEELRGGDASVRGQLEEARKTLHGMQGDLDRQLNVQFEQWDSTQDRSALSRIRSLLDKRKYVSNLVTEVERALSS
jgi:molecular chaperone HscB